MKTLRNTAVGVLIVGLIAVVTYGGAASAHHPILTGATQCRVDTWSVTWTARADEVRGLTWDVTTTGFLPAGSQADSLPFTRTNTYPATQASATVTVNAVWSNQATGSGSATVNRPPLCPVDTTTTTTTTQPSTTTTTQPPCIDCTPGTQVIIPTTTTTTTLPPCVDCTPGTQVVGPDPTTTTTVVSQSSSSSVPPAGDPTTVPPSGTLPATGKPGPDPAPMIAIALALIIGGSAMLTTRRLKARRR